MKFNERLKIILSFLNISQKEFAQQINLSESQLSKLLNGKKKLSVKELKRILDILNLPYDCLFGNVPIFEMMLESCKTVWAER